MGAEDTILWAMETARDGRDELTAAELAGAGLASRDVPAFLAAFAATRSAASPEERWRAVARDLLRPDLPFGVHRLLFSRVYAGRGPASPPAPAFVPDPAETAASRAGRLMAEKGFASFADLHAWSVADRAAFFGEMIGRIGVHFRTPPAAVLDPSGGPEAPRWLPGAVLNIADSCFAGDPAAPAVLEGREGAPGTIRTLSLGDLDALSARVAEGIRAMAVAPGEAVAVALPMTAEAVAIYLGAVRAGCPVVSIADSFAAEEIGVRLRIGRAALVFTADGVRRGGRLLPLYEKVVAASAPRCIVLPAGERLGTALRAADLAWRDFLPTRGLADSVPRGPDDLLNVLFSSGTTGEPKAIPWTHATPIKCAVDAYLHQDVGQGDVVAWPTSLGWMMGPWLVFASLLNRAAVALFDGAPTGREFLEFVRDARVTLLGVVPSLVKAWRAGGCAEGVDLRGVRRFSSTGECSNPDDMLWLMSRAGYRPVVEYCGGTEIGGGYVTGSVVQPGVPGAFSTPAAGLSFLLLDEEGREAREGEVFIVPPSIGLSTTLLNRDHHEIYFAGAPRGPGGEVLRRHGDALARLPGGYFRAHGRVDDTMKLGGIKVSSAEIERLLAGTPGVRETAAVAVPPPGGGPDRLVVFAVPEAGATGDPEALRAAFQETLRRHLNPLFRVDEVVLRDALPRTASNKVLRRELRRTLAP